MADRRQLNPFYVEPEDWMGDDADLEEEALLDALPRRRPAAARTSAARTRKLFSPWLLLALVLLPFLGAKLLIQSPGEGHSQSTSTTSSNSTQHDPNEPRSYVVLGERHSGVEWVVRQLQSCDVRVDETTRPSFLLPSADDFTTTTAGMADVVLVVREPLDWLVAMKQNPSWAPHHAKLNWTTFLSRPWTMPRPDDDWTADCQYGLDYDAVVPCFTLANATYELAGNGIPFDSILALRTAKLRWFLERELTHPILVLHYERLREELATALNCTARDKPPVPTGKRPKVAEQWMNDTLDWEAEHLVGY